MGGLAKRTKRFLLGDERAVARSRLQISMELQMMVGETKEWSYRDEQEIERTQGNKERFVRNCAMFWRQHFLKLCSQEPMHVNNTF